MNEKIGVTKPSLPPRRGILRTGIPRRRVAAAREGTRVCWADMSVRKRDIKKRMMEERGPGLFKALAILASSLLCAIPAEHV